MAQRQQRAADRGVARVGFHIGHEAAVDLQDVQRQVLQVGHVRITGTEIIQRNADALLVHALHGLLGLARLAHQAALGQLHVQRPARQPELLAGTAELGHQVAVEELHRRNVHRDRQVPAGIHQLPLRARRFADHPAAQRQDQPGVFAQLDELARRNEAAIGLRPAQQRLQRGRAAIAGMADRLEIQREFGIDRAVDAPGQAQPVGQARTHCAVEPGNHAAFVARGMRGLRGHADHLFGADHIAIELHRHANARLELVQPVLPAHRFGNGLHQRIQRGLALVVVADGEDEILGRLERQQPIAHAQPTQPLGHGLQHHVAHFAAQRIGHQLQATELHVGDGVAAAFLIQLRGQRAGVEQSGGRVMGGVVGQVALVGHAVADVLGQHQAGLAPVEIQPRQVRAHFEHGAVLAPVQAHLGVLQVATGRVGDRPADFLPAFARADVQDAHRQEFIAAVAVLAHRCFVHFQEAQRVRVEHPERRRVAVEQQAELALGLLRARQRLDPLAHIGERADHAPLAVAAAHLLAARGHPVRGAARQHDAEHFIQHAVAGERIVEGGLQPLHILVVHAVEEIGHRQRIQVNAEHIACQRRPAQHRGILVHRPGADLADLVGHAQFGMAGAQFLAHRILAAGGAAQAGVDQRERAPVQQVQAYRRLHVRPPRRQHILPAQPGVYRQRVLGQRGQGGDALDLVDGTVFNAQRQHRITAHQVTPLQLELLAGQAIVVGAARQYVAGDITDRKHAVQADIQPTDDRLQLAGMQPAEQPAVLAHAQRQRQHPAAHAQVLRRAQVQQAVGATVRLHCPQRQAQVAAAAGQRAAELVYHHDAFQLGMPLQHPIDGVVEQVRRLRRHPVEQLRAVGGDAAHGAFQVAQFQSQQALRTGGQRRALPLGGLQPALVIIDQHHHQARPQQQAQADAQPHDSAQRPRHGLAQRGHRVPLPR